MDPAAASKSRVGEESEAAVVKRVEGGAGNKCMKVELGLELRPSREDPSAEPGQPWLRISATCAERVFM